MGHAISLLTASLLVAQTQSPAPTNPGCSCQKKSNTQQVQYIEPAPVEMSAPRRGLFGLGLFDSTPTPTKTQTQTVSVSEDRPILGGLRKLFGKKDAEPQYRVEPPVTSPSTTTPRLMQRMPEGNSTEGAPQAVPVNNVKIVTPATYQPAGEPIQTIPTTTQSLSIPATPVSATIPTPTSTVASRPSRISPELVGKVGHEQDYSWITGQIRVENGQHVIHFAPPEVVDRYNGSLVLTSATAELRAFRDGEYVSARGQVVQQGSTAVYRLTGIDRLPR